MGSYSGMSEISYEMETFLLDNAENAGAILKKTRRPPSNTYPWFDRECMSEKQIYRKINRSSDDDNIKHEAYNKHRKFLRAKKLKYTEMLNCRLLKLKSANPQEFWSILKRLSSTKPESSIDLYALFEHFQQLGRFSENQIVFDFDHIDMDANIDDLCELN